MKHKNYYSTFLFLWIFLFGSCFPPDYLLKTVEPLYESGVSDSLFRTKLRSDGIYQTQYQSRTYSNPLINEQLLFINSKTARMQFNPFQGSDSSKIDFYIRLIDDVGSKYKGRFYINGDTIFYKELHYYTARGSITKPYTTHYRGIIKNRDTIVDMHMVEPYPTVWPDLNNNFVDEKLPKTFYFKEDKEFLKLDSIFKAVKIIE